jgi:hypothetical protein
MVDMAYTTLVHIPYPLLSPPVFKIIMELEATDKKKTRRHKRRRTMPGAMVIGKATLIVRYTLVTDSFFVE